MTLITLQSRIHFANNVLEEALRGELEELDERTLLVICDARHSDDEFGTRVLSSLPTRISAALISISSEDTKYDTTDRALAAWEPQDCDAIIAFGSARALAHARKARNAVAKRRYAMLPLAERKNTRERAFLPNMYVIPGIDGLPNPCAEASMASASVKAAGPSVIICDPTLTESANELERASAFSRALGNCIEALGLSAFNPLADGLAVEGLRRLSLAGRTDREGNCGLGGRRDLMAAALNGALAQQKGRGALQAILSALEAGTGRVLDGGAMSRILLPAIVNDPASRPTEHVDLIRHVLGFGGSRDLPDCVAEYLAPLPLANSLHDLTLERSDINNAIEALGDAAYLQVPPTERLERILDAAM